MTIVVENLGVYQVFTGRGTGSGFLIDKNHLVTNCHVVSGFRQVAVERRDKTRILGTVRRLHPQRDLAVVELAEALPGEVLSLSSEDRLTVRQEIHIIGFPVGLPLSITTGVVSNPRQMLDGAPFVQTDAAINPGNSGGPMVDDGLAVVAITTCKLSSADMVGFGIPAGDVREFIDGFLEQTQPFGVMCPCCESLLASAERYCESCGTDLDGLELANYFGAPEQHPIASFVEKALENSMISPVLARHGELNWSFHSGSAPIKVWCCCSEHVTFASPLAKLGKHPMGELFRYLLSEEHQPFAFDLDDNIVQLNLTIHMSDVFGRRAGELSDKIAEFVAAADRFDNLLIEEYGCQPAPNTQLTFLKSPAP